ncbi:MAG: sigma-54-dependent Fis family transcriptional regulator [Acidobacteriota bacterium]|nr:MAG: sigma-54-dependent Fis family transcriptional regulator [Acidobacteriota bacterium]
MPKEKVLVVDDEPAIRYTLSEALRGWGFEPLEAGTLTEALEIFESEHPLVVLQDIRLPDGSGLDALREYKKRQPQVVVIMITGNVMVEDTLTAMRGGAHDFISKPINLRELQVTIRNGIEIGQLRREVGSIRRERASQFSFDQIIGSSPVMKEMIALARKVAASEASSVLLQGESGTGKDLVAKAIHYSSSRADNPFITINCAAIPGTLIESELFGHEKGAFTDAKARKEGLFEQGHGGTIFLDEIGEVELSLQAKLLRVLEESSFRRVGGLKDLPLDVRIIAASNKDLRSESEAGHFRLDLYYRLSVIQIDLPALRKRGDDVLALAEFFIAGFNKSLRKRIRGLNPEVESIFRSYQWPGNVRELRNVIERVMILEDSDIITSSWLPRDLMRDERDHQRVGPTATSDEASAGHRVIVPGFILPDSGVELEKVELSMVRQAMDRSGGNQTKAAELLGISRDQLRYRLKKLEDLEES